LPVRWSAHQGRRRPIRLEVLPTEVGGRRPGPARRPATVPATEPRSGDAQFTATAAPRRRRARSDARALTIAPSPGGADGSAGACRRVAAGQFLALGSPTRCASGAEGPRWPPSASTCRRLRRQHDRARPAARQRSATSAGAGREHVGNPRGACHTCSTRCRLARRSPRRRGERGVRSAVQHRVEEGGPRGWCPGVRDHRSRRPAWPPRPRRRAGPTRCSGDADPAVARATQPAGARKLLLRESGPSPSRAATSAGPRQSNSSGDWPPAGPDRSRARSPGPDLEAGVGEASGRTTSRARPGARARARTHPAPGGPSARSASGGRSPRPAGADRGVTAWGSHDREQREVEEICRRSVTVRQGRCPPSAHRRTAAELAGAPDEATDDPTV